MYLGQLILLVLFGQPAFAQPQPKISYCLNSAYGAQISNFKTNSKYFLEEADLKHVLPVGCRVLTYALEKTATGFHVITEVGGETWSVDENFDLVRLTRAGSKPATITGKNSPVESGTSSKSGKGKSAPMAVLAADNLTPLIAQRKFESPLFVRIIEPLASKQVDEDGSDSKMERCFDKRFFLSNACRTYFENLSEDCRKSPSDRIPKVCLDLNRKVTEIHLDDCDGGEEGYGRCELRARQLAKVCENPLRQASADCRSLPKYRERVPIEVAAEPDRRVAAAPAASAPVTPVVVVENTTLKFIKNVRTLQSSLRKLMRFRPVSFESSDGGKDVGFVADEVENIDAMYANYSQNHDLQGVRYDKITALLTGGIQELYGLCQANNDGRKELLQKIFILQEENAELKKRLYQHQKDITVIKAKLGID